MAKLPEVTQLAKLVTELQVRLAAAEQERDEACEAIRYWYDVTRFTGTHRTCTCSLCLELHRFAAELLGPQNVEEFERACRNLGRESEGDVSRSQVDKPVCTCHERDSSITCDACKAEGYYGHMERAPESE